VSPPLLDVAGLNVRFATSTGAVHAVRDLSFSLRAGESLGIVGESGSGKSQAVLALTGLLADNGRASGSARLEGSDLITLDQQEMNRVRGPRISMIFQDPMTSLNPYLSVGRQMSLALRAHRAIGEQAARKEAAEMLETVGIPEAARRIEQYPHELSGGMRQRVMIATALLLRPALLIADEPTTALDVTVQAQILGLMSDLRERYGTAIIIITHDLSVVAGLADRILVMQRGEKIEEGPVDAIFAQPQQAYTRSLLAAVPRFDRPIQGTPPRMKHATKPILAAESVRVEFPVADRAWFRPRRLLRAVDDVSFQLEAGEILGVVGESGCGKSTLGRAVLQLVPVSAGRVSFLGADDAQSLRRDLQVVFQDPLASLNPRMTIRDVVAEPLEVHEPTMGDKDRTNKVADMLSRVGLDPSLMNRYPHQFSGGQCQRVAIARALITRPKLVVCDEAVSALDVSVREQILRLMLELRRLLDLSLIFIGHDLAVIRQISQRVMVMYLGRVMEIAAADQLFTNPQHPYTQALISAVPIPDPVVERARKREGLRGELPSPLAPPSGCVFRTRCAFAIARCATEVPALRLAGASQVACHRAGEVFQGR